MNSWDLKEAELLEQETEYLRRYNWFEKIVDNHWHYLLLLTVTMLIAFNIGFGIGLLL